MTDNQALADNQDDPGDQARKDAAQAKLMKGVINVLRDNREALYHLPEMFEQLTEMQTAIASAEKATDTLGESRGEEYKLILAQREKEDLSKKVKYLKDDNDIKEERIKTLEKIIEDQKGNISAVRSAQSSKMSTDDGIVLLQRELQTIEKEKAEKEKQISLLKKEAADREKALLENNKTLTIRNDDLIRGIGIKEEELKDQAEKISSLENKLQAVEERKEEKEEKFVQLKELYKTTVSGKDREIEQLKNRLASLSEKRVKQDQSNVEDTLSLNRQSQLEEDFANFIDEARMDACDSIQTFYQLQEKIDVEIYYPRLACLIFEAAYERMKEARKASFEFCKEIAKGLIDSAPGMGHHYSLNEKGGNSSFKVTFTVSLLRQESQYPADVLDALMLNLKETAPTCNLDGFVKDVMQVAWIKWSTWQSYDKHMKHMPSQYVLRDPSILAYIKACIRLTWRMVTQIPPMQIEYNSVKLQDIHKKIGYHSSPDMCTIDNGSSAQSQGEEIACYLWPGLLDGGGRLIRAGEVLCKIKKER